MEYEFKVHQTSYLNKRPMNHITHPRIQKYFATNFPWKKVCPFILTHWILFRETVRCFVLRLVEMVLEKMILIVGNVFFNIISFWKKPGPVIRTSLNLFTQGCFVPSLVEISELLKKKMKMWKLYRQRDWQQVIKKLTWAFYPVS